MSSGNFVRQAALTAHGQLDWSRRPVRWRPDRRPDGDGNCQRPQNGRPYRLLSIHMRLSVIKFECRISIRRSEPFARNVLIGNQH